MNYSYPELGYIYNNTVREKSCHISQLLYNSLYISKIKAGRQLDNRVIYQPIYQPILQP